VSDVLPYAAQVRTRGLTLLSAPGNDLVSATALAMSGCQMVLFTTGRGTPFTCPVPTVKIASNSALAARKGGWIDFDAGRLLSGGAIDALAEELLDTVIAVASGDMHTRSEALDKSDLAIFKTGVTV
jgi:altronate hydrolase